MLITTKDKTLIFDESGNLGCCGRYFVISCIETNNPKEIHNIIKKKTLQAKKQFPTLQFNGNELKAFNAFPLVKHHILECICTKDISISYIVADLNHIDAPLLLDKNLLYNYMLKLLINRIIGNGFTNKALNIWIDNHTVKVQSVNSFSDFIKIHLNYERCLNLNIDVEYIDSKSSDGFVIQAADFVANTIYTKFEYDINLYFDVIKNNINISEHFPRAKFGK